ncbi:MAG: ATPase [Dysgonamonadaceae bacterium]|jgi:AAA+ ATPase superfamily predicted ATPase|nr:ATPase [Dysgonamonadaceae bacterium]
MTKLQNPFITGGYIAPKYFCDREKETELLLKNIQNGNNITLISTRRMGKSGLIHHCFNNARIMKNYTTFFVDIYATKSLSDLVFLLSKNIFNQLKSTSRKVLENFLITLKSLRSEISFDEHGVPSLTLGIGDIRKPEVSLDEIFQFLNNSTKPCVVAIDEFQQITKYPETNTEALLRTYIQQSPQTRFIFSGSQRHIMGEMFNSAARPFFASTSTIYLHAIEKEEYIAFAQKHFKAHNREITPTTVEKVYDLFEGITWYIQKTLNTLFGETPEGAICDIKMVNETIGFIIDSNKYIYSENMFRLPDKQGKLLIAMAKEGKVLAPTSADFVRKYNLISASSVQAALKGLLEKEFVTRDETSYVVYDKFFEVWLREKY